VLPGELILLLGGVLAQQGRVPLGAALAAGTAGALAVAWLLRRPARRHNDEPGQLIAAGRRRH
jgi:membrane protein DedA with SNARE-associated domain